MDQKSLHTLEYHKILVRLAEHTGFSAGRDLALALQPTTEVALARLWQAETREARALFDSDADITIGGARDVRTAVERTERGYVLGTDEFLAVKNTLIAARTLRRKLLRLEDSSPHLADIAAQIEECPGLVAAITNTIDDQGEVLDSASPALARIRRDLSLAYNRLQDKLRTLLNSSNGQYLQEPIITLRAGRYVVPLRAEHKGRIKGVVHDQSGSGATLWIEPLFTVELNNQYRSLQIQEAKEIERILGELSADIAQQGEVIKRVVNCMAELDLIFARARFAAALDGVEPQFVDWKPAKAPNRPKHHNKRPVDDTVPFVMHPGSTLWIRAARHPLLDPGTVVPTDFLVDDDIFIVLITGPNTGGKTVSLKNLGLMVLMAQSGLHLPAVDARLTVFDDVFADIGDEQSIEQSLSTFSGHITNIVRILERVDERSLVLFDELGSGTDPAEGAAIAQAITSYLRDKGATTFVATHYPELKLYANQTPGATNASLLFDIDTLSPTYEMIIGIPGKSNALAIARRLGLDDGILDEAMVLLGGDTTQTEALLESIHTIREKIVSEEAATRVALRSAEQERDVLLTRLEQIDAERREILNNARRQAEEELEAVREEIRLARRQIREAASLNALKKTGQLIEAIQDEIPDTVEPTPMPDRQPSWKQQRALQPGDTVYVKTLQTTGEIIEVDRKSAAVAVGRLHTRVDIADLQLRERVEEEPTVELGISSSPARPSVKMELDLRGQRVEAGLARLEQYLDTASLSGLPFVRIIHGKGTGALRKAVRQALSTSRYVSSWEEGREGEGDAGVTVAHLRHS
ncbi:MAG: Smr/MutS family protein [Anaerolineae bacterium]|nr:Smr/MutS family protein [Anaerolineae bacterium]